MKKKLKEKIEYAIFRIIFYERIEAEALKKEGRFTHSGEERAAEVLAEALRDILSRNDLKALSEDLAEISENY